RRHTRFSRDWSSDVCSSDLVEDSANRDAVPISGEDGFPTWSTSANGRLRSRTGRFRATGKAIYSWARTTSRPSARWSSARVATRSEERRVGKEGRWSGEVVV